MCSYPQYSQFSEIKQRLPILEAVGRYLPGLQLKCKVGKWWACCPFHNERTASFTISSKRNRWHCFGCGEHGDTVDLIAKYHGISLADAVKRLANDLGLSSIPINSKDHRELQRQISAERRLTATAEQMASYAERIYSAVCAAYVTACKWIDKLMPDGLDKPETAGAFEVVFLAEWFFRDWDNRDIITALERARGWVV